MKGNNSDNLKDSEQVIYACVEGIDNCSQSRMWITLMFFLSYVCQSLFCSCIKVCHIGFW